MKAAVAALHDDLAPLGGDELSDEVEWDTDHGPFLSAGIPAINMMVDMTEYNEVHHKIADTFERVNSHSLAAGTALLAVTTWKVAEMDHFAPHIDRAAVTEILKKDGTDELLKVIGEW